MQNNKKKQIIKISMILGILLLIVGVSYAFINLTLEGTRRQVITAGVLELILDEDENNLTIENALPMYDEVGMIQEPFTFRLINNSGTSANYILKLEEINTTELARSDVKYGLEKDGVAKIDLVSNIVDNVIDEGTIAANTTIEYTLRLWIKSDVTEISQIQGKMMSFRIGIQAEQDAKYTEDILNGADPVLTDNLVPVIIRDDGTVTKADINEQWYDYDNQEWANAVVLADNTQTYDNEATIPESNIESYFVWIPKYSYQLWDLGNYNSLTSVDNTKPHTILLEFGITNTSDSVTGECTTPKTAGTSGNCAVGEYVTHPAFLAFNTNGFWVGKFETGYDGATSTTGAEVDSADSSKIIIKPNVYSWRNITVGNAFKISYDYLREDESHMMKNTEWGAVAYLQHSAYGSQASVRVNNNSAYITGYSATEEPTLGHNGAASIEGNKVESTALGADGTYTVNYLNTLSQVSSTTGNYSGVYDMAGGAWEYVMGYNTAATTEGGSSEILDIHEKFFTDVSWNKYYDEYTNSGTYYENYNNRILGDATGEMGPFGSQVDPDTATRYVSSWYQDYGQNATPSYPWLTRGSGFYNGVTSGAFAFNIVTGGVYADLSFRVVLTP